ncbi:hypothetical protein [Bacillus sp. T33-2]|uniref:hypothetical protein n=1 Tax=Bacillus sp. T33-2 TaxID=2054168 RepID=UPI000C76AE2A|nr:hypothetical protein [Bacillus sp. T33-2]PLR99774.1 hypothetical protein CVD19_01570 [Bacillus sp. T33-2]
MLGNVVRFISGFVCTYLWTEWVPVSHPFDVSEFFVELVLDPFDFFVSAIIFIIGLIAYGSLIREGIRAAGLVSKKRQGALLPVSFIWISILAVLLFLFKAGPWQMIIFLGFSLLYGIISLGFNEKKYLVNK